MQQPPRNNDDEPDNTGHHTPDATSAHLRRGALTLPHGLQGLPSLPGSAHMPTAQPLPAAGHGRDGASWVPLMDRLRSDMALAPRLKELALCAVAALNGADDALHHHGPLLLAAGGTPAQLQALCQLPQLQPGLWDDTERATLALCLQMTRAEAVTGDVFDNVRRQLGNDELLFELVGVVSTYNMVSRALVVADVRVPN